MYLAVFVLRNCDSDKNYFFQFILCDFVAMAIVMSSHFNYYMIVIRSHFNVYFLQPNLFYISKMWTEFVYILTVTNEAKNCVCALRFLLLTKPRKHI